MNLSDTDHREVIAQIAAALLAKNPLDLDEITIVATATVAQCLGISPSAVARKFPITEIGPRTRGVRLKTLRSYLDANTRKPAA